MTVVLSNGYISFLITKVNGPPPPKLFDTIKSLLCKPILKEKTFSETTFNRFQDEILGRVESETRIYREYHNESDCFSVLSSKLFDGFDSFDPNY